MANSTTTNLQQRPATKKNGNQIKNSTMKYMISDKPPVNTPENIGYARKHKIQLNKSHQTDSNKTNGDEFQQNHRTNIQI